MTNTLCMTDVMRPSFDPQQILNGDEQQLGELFNSINSAPLALRTSTADKFFTRVFTRNPLDAACTPLIEQLKNIFSIHVCQNDNFYCNANHPLRQLFECVLTRAITWHPRDAKPNQQFFEKLSQLIHLAQVLPEEADTFLIALQEFCLWDDAEEKRAAMLESRLCESELNHLKMLTAECRVLDLINEALTGCQLPLAIIESIPSTLKSELQHCAFTAGIGSPFWKTWQRLLPLFANVFNINEQSTDDQQLYHHIPAMLEELERSTRMDISNPEHYQQFVDHLNDALMHIIKKQSLPLSTLEMLPYPPGHSDTRTRVTDSILQQSAGIQQGNWILFTGEDGNVIRCKLALKNETTDQLLFVDRTGRKVMIKSNKDFALCLSTGIAKPLKHISLTDLIDELINALITLYENNVDQQQQAQAERKQQEQLQQQQEELKQQQLTLEKQQEAERKSREEQKIREEQQRRSLEFSEQRRRAAEKALAEAKALADEKIARAIESALAEKKHQEEQQDLPSTTQMQQLIAQQNINALNVGAWIERFDEQQQKQRCKLAVYIASAGKYIFVDNLGRKVAEYQREQLLEAFLTEQVAIINNGDKFEDQLAKVIRSLRKDVS